MADSPVAHDHGFGRNLPRLVEIMRRLLAPGGCPWDQEQTPRSLRKYVMEEACEVIDAIDREDASALREELGDLLLQVVFQSEIARKQGTFVVDDVVEGICEKLERRHPHVFGDVEVDDAAEVHRNWERIKAEEKLGRGVLEGVPRSLPALSRAQRLGEKAARVGFDWPDRTGCRAKVDEELAELDAALASNDTTGAAQELGDVLFAVVNLARHINVDAELALRETIGKFVTRFAVVESEVQRQHGGFGACGGAVDIDTLEQYWQEAKRREKT